MLEKEEKRLQKSVEKSKMKMTDLEREEKRLQKLLDKAKNGSHKEDINAKIKVVQEQMEKLEAELNSQLESQNLITQIEVNNNPFFNMHKLW
jgi:hypothetical protein